MRQQLVLSFAPRWSLSHQAIGQSCKMLKIFSHSAQRKSASPFLVLSHCLLFISLCSQAHGGQTNVAYFAGGCFWCTEAVFEEAPGVTSVISGYMQGAETIQVTFDPAKTTYRKLLILFWEAHDPTQVDRQGADVGKQYRSAIFYVNDQQRDAAQRLKGEVQKFYSKPISTEITQAGSFRPAPESHQNFCRKNPNSSYVQQVIEPKLKKLGLKKP